MSSKLDRELAEAIAGGGEGDAPGVAKPAAPERLGPPPQKKSAPSPYAHAPSCSSSCAS